MSEEPTLLPSVQLPDAVLVKHAIRHLEELGIAAGSVPVADVPADELPEWADADAGGWLLLIDESAWEEGMNAIDTLMEFEPEWSPEDME
ncbi:hypothetical protein HQ576_14950, partial [bacterium]|nr:hypothetical protein [bacterium]